MPLIVYGLDASAIIAGVKRVNNSLGSIGKKAVSVGASVTKFFVNPLTAGLTAIGGGFSAAKLIESYDEYTNMAGQLEYLTGSATAAAEAQDALYQMSQQTGTSMTNNAKALTRFQLASDQTGLSTEQNVQALGAINTLLLKTGVSTSEATAGMIQLGQALASGRLQGDEFRSLSENMPALMMEISKSLGVTKAELKEMSTAGELTSETLGKVFLEMAQSASATGEELPLTFSRMWAKVVNAAENAWDRINDETGIMAWIAEGIDNLSIWIEENTPRIVQFFIDMKDKAIEAWPDIKEFFYNVADYGAQMWEVFQLVWPYMAEGAYWVVDAVTASIPKVQEIIAWVKEAIEYFKTLAKYTPLAAYSRSAGTLAGGGSIIDAAKAFFDTSGTTEITNTTTTTTDQSTTNVYIDQELSRSDVVSILDEFDRIATR